MLCVSDHIAIPFSRRKALRLYEFDRENKSINEIICIFVT